jgi:hypothetical protein
LENYEEIFGRVQEEDMKFGEDQKGLPAYLQTQRSSHDLEYPPVRSTRMRLSITPKGPK